MHTHDFLVIGGGIVGISLARAIKKSFPDCSVLLIEKEKRLGLHASGRNSGVLHAGFYYTEDSFKAKFCREGNRHLTEFCEERNLAINRCGKLVVARNEAELNGLDLLYRRGVTNGVDLKIVDSEEATRIEPRVKTFQRALFSPTTSSVDPTAIVTELALDLVRMGVTIRTDTAYLGRDKKAINSSRGLIHAGYVVNCAGLYADKIARDFGFSNDYRILPFKGLYLYSEEPAGSLRTHIYPVPDLNYPFLGVHFTVTVGGKTKIGPTAIPALWRENYSWSENFRLNELIETVQSSGALLWAGGREFARVVQGELRKYSKGALVDDASTLVQGVKKGDYSMWGIPGIRAQVVNIKTRRLEMDFLFEAGPDSFHVLNAVSPAFTCSLPFADYLVDRIKHSSSL